MDRACGTHGDRRRVSRERGNLKDRDHFEDVGVDGRIILKCILN
jgi:hypothetical protein